MGRNYVYGGSIWEGIRSEERLVGNGFIVWLREMMTASSKMVNASTDKRNLTNVKFLEKREHVGAGRTRELCLLRHSNNAGST